MFEILTLPPGGTMTVSSKGSMRGATGASGSNGATGAQGPQGPAGNNGAQGPAGPAPSGTGFVVVNNGILATPLNGNSNDIVIANGTKFSLPSSSILARSSSGTLTQLYYTI